MGKAARTSDLGCRIARSLEPGAALSTAQPVSPAFRARARKCNAERRVGPQPKRGAWRVAPATSTRGTARSVAAHPRSTIRSALAGLTDKARAAARSAETAARATLAWIRTPFPVRQPVGGDACLGDTAPPREALAVAEAHPTVGLPGIAHRHRPRARGRGKLNAAAGAAVELAPAPLNADVPAGGSLALRARDRHASTEVTAVGVRTATRGADFVREARTTRTAAVVAAERVERSVGRILIVAPEAFTVESAAAQRGAPGRTAGAVWATRPSARLASDAARPVALAVVSASSGAKAPVGLFVHYTAVTVGVVAPAADRNPAHELAPTAVVSEAVGVARAIATDVTQRQALAVTAAERRVSAAAHVTMLFSVSLLAGDALAVDADVTVEARRRVADPRYAHPRAGRPDPAGHLGPAVGLGFARRRAELVRELASSVQANAGCTIAWFRAEIAHGSSPARREAGVGPRGSGRWGTGRAGGADRRGGEDQEPCVEVRHRRARIVGAPAKRNEQVALGCCAS